MKGKKPHKATRFCRVLKDLGGRAKASPIAKKLNKKPGYVSMTIHYELTPQYIDIETDPETGVHTFVLNGTGERLVEDWLCVKK